MRSGRRKTTPVLLALAALVTLLGACGPDTPPSSEMPDPHRIIASGAVGGLVDAGLPQRLLDDANDPSTLLLMQQVSTNNTLPAATATLTYRSAEDLERALRRNEVPESMPWLLLDLEGWSLTPKREQRDPIAALRRAVDAAHGHGKKVLFAPGITLMNVLAPDASGDDLYQAFIDQLVTPGAEIADGFEIQSQRTEATEYAASFVRTAVKAAVAVHPAGAPVLVGVSTNPNGRQVTAHDMETVYDAGMTAGATGYWLNVPSGGEECPNCGEPQYAIGVEFLTKVS